MNTQPSGFGALLRDLGTALGDLFTGGKLEAGQETQVEVVFGLLGLLARIDSIVTSHEAEFVNQLMDELQLPTDGRRIAMEAFNRGRQREIDLATETQRFLAKYPIGSPEVDRLHGALVRLATSDGRIQPRERTFLEELTVRLGYEAYALEARLKAVTPR